MNSKHEGLSNNLHGAEHLHRSCADGGHSPGLSASRHGSSIGDVRINRLVDVDGSDTYVQAPAVDAELHESCEFEKMQTTTTLNGVCSVAALLRQGRRRKHNAPFGRKPDLHDEGVDSGSEYREYRW